MLEPGGKPSADRIPLQRREKRRGGAYPSGLRKRFCFSLPFRGVLLPLLTEEKTKKEKNQSRFEGGKNFTQCEEGIKRLGKKKKDFSLMERSRSVRPHRRGKRGGELDGNGQSHGVAERPSAPVGRKKGKRRSVASFDFHGNN